MEAKMQSIPNRLKMHRKMHRLKQRHVAKLLGFQTSAQLSQWENGQTMPSGENLIKLGIIYNTFPNELYFEYYQQLKEAIKVEQERLP
jgi:transcriptional regulator with XRE-family HTH domain